LVTFIVLPVFALANAGVTLEGDVAQQMLSPLALGIVLGLFLGKQLGITAATWLAVKLRLADLPAGVTWKQIHGVSILAGIGFTMSLFVASLAFTTEQQMAEGKIGILSGSVVSGIIGYFFLKNTPPVRSEETLES
jgi:Na+:H+ antiporter, NhaA family